jgi:hypothetical protein
VGQPDNAAMRQLGSDGTVVEKDSDKSLGNEVTGQKSSGSAAVSWVVGQLQTGTLRW